MSVFKYSLAISAMLRSRGYKNYLKNYFLNLRKMWPFWQIRKIQNCKVTNDEEKKLSSIYQEEELDETRVRIVEEIIMNNTEMTRDHLTPELRLRLLTPNCRLYNAPIMNEALEQDDSTKIDERKIFHHPFWSIYWPGGQALTRFVLDHGKELLNESKNCTNFLDLGAGCGASAIAAKMIGASRVTANDIDKVACVAAKLNATLNDVNIEITSENLLENRVREYESSLDVILVGDLLYDAEMAESLIPWLEVAARRNGSRIYLGDPGRHALTEALKSRMKLRKTYSLPENVRRENYGYDVATVWQFNVK